MSYAEAHCASHLAADPRQRRDVWKVSRIVFKIKARGTWWTKMRKVYYRIHASTAVEPNTMRVVLATIAASYAASLARASDSGLTWFGSQPGQSRFAPHARPSCHISVRRCASSLGVGLKGTTNTWRCRSSARISTSEWADRSICGKPECGSGGACP